MGRPDNKRIRRCPPPGSQLDPGLVPCEFCGSHFPRESLPGHRANSKCGQAFREAQNRRPAVEGAQPVHDSLSGAAPREEPEAEARGNEQPDAPPLERQTRAIRLSGLAHSVQQGRGLAAAAAAAGSPGVEEQGEESENFSPLVAAVAGACAQLHRTAKDELLRQIAPPLGLPWATAAAFDASMLDDGQEWKTVEVGRYTQASGKEHVITALLRTDLIECLQELLLSPDAVHAQLDAVIDENGQGQRVYTEVFNSMWLQQKQVAIHAAGFPSHARVYPYIIFSDGTELDRGTAKFHPVYLWPACFPLAYMRKHRNYRRIGMIPVLNAEALGLGQPRHADFFKVLRRQIFYSTLHHLLKPLKAASHMGCKFRLLSEEEAFLVPLPMSHNSDKLEQADIAGIMNWPSEHPDISSLIPQASLGDPDVTAPPRTEVGTAKVVRAARELLDEGREVEAVNLLRTQSLFAARESALAGFGFTDFIHLLNPDRLHCGPKGLLERLVTFIKQPLRDAGTAYADTNRLLKESPGFPGLRVPQQGLDWPRITATEMAALARMLIVPLSGASDEIGVLEDLIDLLQEFLTWETLRDSPFHTEESLGELRQVRISFQRKACAYHDDLERPGNFRVPKLEDMRKFEHTIRQFGTAAITSAALGEAAHKSVKRAIAFTNRHESSLNTQVMSQLRKADSARRLAEQDATGGATGQGVAQRAQRSGKQVLVITKKLLPYAKLASPEAAADHALARRLLTDQPELVHMERCLRSYLASLVTEDHVVPSNWATALPHAHGSVVKVASKMALPYCLHRESGLQGVVLLGNEAHGYDNVAVRGKEGETWFAQLRLLFSCSAGGAFGAEHELAFVRWYQEAPATQESSGLGMTRLKWAETRLPGRQGHRHPFYDVIAITSINCPVMLQIDPCCNRGLHFLHNHYF